MADDATDIIQGFWADFYGTASYVSMAALAIYDHCITFDREVQHIWSRRFNLSSAIFIVNRYLNLLGILALTSIQLFSRTPSSGRRHSCLGLWYFVSIALIFQDIADLSFFVVRTWAIWGRHLLPLLVLAPFGLSVAALNSLDNFETKYGGLYPLQSPYGGCLLISTVPDNLSRRFSPIIISRMILDLKSIHQVSTSGSLSDLQSSQISSIRFIGSIGAPLNDTTVMTENEDEDEATNPDTATTRLVSIKQIIEDPLSIGLFDEKYNSATERGSAAVSIA
ncbi:hypothetical protein C8Q75DRAFT_810593 [Abortiporus biennis]|nr:hypothetical protein C8Q75DRAFT_810593 [Abortiporus biennis]